MNRYRHTAGASRSATRTAAGFTLVELLVVIAIIALLMGILLPVLGEARSLSRAVKSMTNLKGWGTATAMLLTENDGLLPWEGRKPETAAELQATFLDMDASAQAGRPVIHPTWWGNMLPPFVDEKPYAELAHSAFDHAGPDRIPLPPKNHFFIDPAAELDNPDGFTMGTLKYYFSYVVNSEMNKTLQDEVTFDEEPFRARVHIEDIPEPGVTVWMFEMRASNTELDNLDDGVRALYDTESALNPECDLRRVRADWKRFGARHFQGAHVLYTDTHVDRQRHEDVIRRPDPAENDWNQQRLIWNPFGPSTE